MHIVITIVIVAWLISECQDADENPYHRLHLEGHTLAVRALAARGRTLVSGSYDCTVRIWDIITGACKWVLEGHTQKGTWGYSARFLYLSNILQYTAWYWIPAVIRLVQDPWTAPYASGT